MHIIIGIITAAAGLIWALYRLQSSGVDLNAFNPFHWAHRRKWQKKFGTKPIHNIQDPKEAATVLVLAIAQFDGQITREQRALIIELFAKEFSTSETEANELYVAASHLIKNEVNLENEVVNILAPTKALYQDRHIASLLSMLSSVSQCEGSPSSMQLTFITNVKSELQSPSVTKKAW